MKGKKSVDVHQIEQFVTVARFSNMTLAAKELGVSQPSLSQSIKKLEESIGVNLFDRNGRTLVLNEYGEILLRQADIALRAIDNATKEIRDTPDYGQGAIRLIARCPLGNVAYVFEKYNKEHPEIVLSCVTPAEGTLKTDYDIELVASPVPLNNKYSIKICDEHFIVCVPEKHRFANRKTISFKELLNERFIMSSAESSMNSVINGMFNEAGFKPKVSGYVSVFSDMLRCVEQGMGICIATDITWLIGMDIKVVPLQIADIHRRRALYVTWPDQAYLSKRVLNFIYYICEQFRLFADSQRLQDAISND